VTAFFVLILQRISGIQQRFFLLSLLSAMATPKEKSNTKKKEINKN